MNQKSAETTLVPSGQLGLRTLPTDTIRTKEQRHLNLGLFLNDIPADKLEIARQDIHDHLEDEFNLEPLFFEDIHVFRHNYTLNHRFYEPSVQKEPWLKKDNICPKRVSTAYGVTRLHDDIHVLWQRRTLHDYVADGNSLPNSALAIIDKIAQHVPVGMDMTVWSPAPAPPEVPEMNIDPMIVLEAADKLCVGLCRWNPTL